MRRLILGVLVCLVAVPVAADDAQLMAPIRKFVDSFNKGDVAAAASTHAATAELAIIDEVAPFMWRGAKAFETWSAALESESKKMGVTDQVVTLGTPIREESNGVEAYVVVPADYRFKERGVAMREKAQMTFALKKGPDGWLIHGWAWTGPKPERAE